MSKRPWDYDHSIDIHLKPTRRPRGPNKKVRDPATYKNHSGGTIYKKTLNEIVDILGTTKQNVSDHIDKAMSKFLRRLFAKLIGDYSTREIIYQLSIMMNLSLADAAEVVKKHADEFTLELIKKDLR